MSKSSSQKSPGLKSQATIMQKMASDKSNPKSNNFSDERYSELMSLGTVMYKDDD